MTDTTDQQAVTVAQIEAEARRYAAMYPEASDGRNTFVMFADMVSRLASVSSASAEPRKDTVAFVQEWMMSGDHEPDQWHRDFAAAIDARRPTEQSIFDAINEECGTDAAAWIIARLAAAASPEPVPATNQAGEVDGFHFATKVDDPFGQSHIEATKLALTATPETFPRDSYGLAQWLDKALFTAVPTKYETGSEWDPGAYIRDWCPDHVRDYVAALATQPATSQEGEVSVDDALAFADQIAEQHRQRANAAEARIKAATDCLIQPGEDWQAYSFRLREALATQPATSQEDSEMPNDQVKQMVSRFLAWKLPSDFHPDAGITFRAAFNEHADHPMTHEPTGTNLFTATQAEAMIRHLLDGLSSKSQQTDVDQQAADYAADYVMTTEGNDYVPTEWERELIIDALHGFIADHWNAALATQPATLQEGDSVRRDDIRRSIIRQLGDDPYADRIILNGTDWDIVLEALRAPTAATPTPPTLSEDLREAAQAVVDDYPVAAGMYPSLEGTDGKPGYGSIRRLAAALAQVKAS